MNCCVWIYCPVSSKQMFFQCQLSSSLYLATFAIQIFIETQQEKEKDVYPCNKQQCVNNIHLDIHPKSSPQKPELSGNNSNSDQNGQIAKPATGE